MANKKGMSIQPAITTLSFKIPAGVPLQTESLSYIDTARELSKCNRRMYSQSRMYGLQGLTYIWKTTSDIPAAGSDPARTLATIECSVRTAGNTWIVQNAHTKGHALWKQMQDLVLLDNPSIAGKWHDFKLLLHGDMTSGRTLACLDGQGVPYLAGEWALSTFVMPQHEVDPATGLPLDAVEFEGLLIGPDTPSRRSMVKAYAESRATVFPDAPNVPAGMSTSFFNLLTDSGSQEPELSVVIEAENDNPPYSLLEYPAGSINGNTPVTVCYGAISQSEVDGQLGGFVAPCGLVEIEIKGFDTVGNEWPVDLLPSIDLLLHVAPGSYKGVASIPMGQ